MHIEFNTIFWLGIWYLAVAIITASFLVFFRYINMPKWRDDHGDRTSEVGYFEDSVGRVVADPLNDEGETEAGDVVAPHVQGSTNQSAGW